jgi:hypothetical protein
MELTPQKKTSHPGYPRRLFAAARRSARRVATALMASAAMLMVACPGAMVPPSDPTIAEPEQDASVEAGSTEPETEPQPEQDEGQDDATSDDEKKRTAGSGPG